MSLRGIQQRIGGLSNQGKAALAIGAIVFVGTEIASKRILQKPLHSALSLGLVALTVFNVECLARPIACPNWAWVNVVALGLNMLALFAGRQYMTKVEEAKKMGLGLTL